MLYLLNTANLDCYEYYHPDRSVIQSGPVAFCGWLETKDCRPYRTEVQPCMDCRFCWKKKECVIKDGMQDIYQKLEEADNIVLASPMYFHSITGRMKTLIDRFQVYWAGHVRQDMPEKMLRRGAILMVGGAPSFENQFLGGEIVLKNLLNDLSAECLGQVCLPNSDRDSLETRKDIADQVIALAEAMNQASESLDPYNKV